MCHDRLKNVTAELVPPNRAMLVITVEPTNHSSGLETYQFDAGI